MKRFIVLISLAVVLWAGVAPRRGLVVNEFDGKVVVNTHPQQPMELNPWQQPRLKIHMEWPVPNKHEVKILLSFLSMSKKNKLCAGLVDFNGIWSERAGYENRFMKGGLWEIAYIGVNVDILEQLALSKMPLKVKVCGEEFYLHKYEAEDLRQAVEIWREWR